MSDEPAKADPPAEGHPVVKLLIDLGPLLVFFLAYLADRRKVKQSEDLIAERSPFS